MLLAMNCVWRLCGPTSAAFVWWVYIGCKRPLERLSRYKLWTAGVVETHTSGLPVLAIHPRHSDGAVFLNLHLRLDVPPGRGSDPSADDLVSVAEHLELELYTAAYRGAAVAWLHRAMRPQEKPTLLCACHATVERSKRPCTAPHGLAEALSQSELSPLRSEAHYSASILLLQMGLGHGSMGHDRLFGVDFDFELDLEAVASAFRPVVGPASNFLRTFSSCRSARTRCKAASCSTRSLLARCSCSVPSGFSANTGCAATARNCVSS